MRSLIIAALSLLLAVPSVAFADTASDNGGVALGVQLLSSFIGSEDRPANPPEGAVYVDEVAPGLQLWLGYAFSPAFLLRLSVSGATHESNFSNVDVRVSSAMLEAVYHVSTAGRLRPYVYGGLGGYALRSLQDRFEFESEGGAIDLGAGINYFVSRRVSFDLSARADFINWDKTTATVELESGEKLTVETPVDENGTAAKILFGIGVWF